MSRSVLLLAILHVGPAWGQQAYEFGIRFQPPNFRPTEFRGFSFAGQPFRQRFGQSIQFSAIRFPQSSSGAVRREFLGRSELREPIRESRLRTRTSDLADEGTRLRVASVRYPGFEAPAVDATRVAGLDTVSDGTRRRITARPEAPRAFATTPPNLRARDSWTKPTRLTRVRTPFSGGGAVPQVARRDRDSIAETVPGRGPARSAVSDGVDRSARRLARLTVGALGEPPRR